MSVPRILVTGADGQLGFELARAFAGRGEVVALGREGLDLSSPTSVRDACDRVRPRLILNAGAYTAVDRAESEPALAMAINGEAPGLLADWARRHGATMVHYSTDYVFDGRATAPYAETDAVGPDSVYGRTKLAGEAAVQAAGGEVLLFRVSWLYGNRRHNFYRTMIRLAGERPELRVVADQVGCPTWVRPVADITAQCLDADLAPAIPGGIYHLSSSGATSWHGFASAILAGMGDEQVLARTVVPLTTAEYPTPARRPAYSVLSCRKLEAALGTRMTAWQAQLAGCLAERGTAKP